MKVLKSIFNFYISSSIHVALAVCALTWVTLLQFELELNSNLLFFVFFASITGYNFVKYFGLAKFHHRRLAVWLKVIQVFSFLAFIGLCYFGFQLKVNTIILISILGFVTFLYAIPMLPKTYFIDENKNLRQIGGLKIYIIALVWAFVTVGLPIIESDFTCNTDVIITGLQRFCFVMVLMLPFEIRDLNYDSLKLATIPQKIGVKKTKVIGVLLMMVFVMLEFFKDELNGFTVMSALVITFITLLFLIFSDKNRSKYYTAFWVESLPVIWLGLLLVFN